MNSDSDEELEYECEAFEVLGQTISAMTVGELPLHVLANLSNRDAEISGQRVWAGSLLLAHYLGRGQGETLLGAGRALELGCGTGVLGIALKKALGEKLDVDLTDGDPKAIELLHENAVLNGLADDAGIFELFWGNEESMGAFREQRPDKYPVIMAGDVLYKKLLIQPLLQTVEKLLAPDGIFYLCHIPRFDVFHDVVAMAFSAGGWNVTNVIAPASILEKYPAPETWDSETLGDLRRAQIYEVRAPER